MATDRLQIQLFAPFSEPQMTLIRSLALALLAVLATGPVAAQMIVSNAIVHFEPGEPARQDIEVENTGSETMYVEIKPQMVVEPGTINESRKNIVDPREDGLLVTPNKLVVGPGARKRVRFVNLEPNPEDERVYRVTIAPVVSHVEAEQTGIKILIGYEVLVLVQPRKPVAELLAKRDGERVWFENNGNTNVLLREGYQCENKELPREECDALRGKRLYPGNSWELDLPRDRPVEYFVSVGTKNSVRAIP